MPASRGLYLRGSSPSPHADEREHDIDIVHNVYNHPNAGEIDLILAQYVPPHVVSYISDQGARIVPLPDGMTYANASPAIRRLAAGVDTWPLPPAGLFVVEERTIYLRTISSMTIVHELGHALDCALGKGVYHRYWRVLRAVSDAQKELARCEIVTAPAAMP